MKVNVLMMKANVLMMKVNVLMMKVNVLMMKVNVLKLMMKVNVFYVSGKSKLYLRQMMKSHIHKALQLEVCDQCIQKLSEGRLKVSQIDFLYLLLP